MESFTRVIIVDDEELIREQIEFRLKKESPDFIVVQKCRNGKEAIKAVMVHKPHLVFLDVQMPVMNGFDFLKQFISIDFEIIFVTAYNHYAIQAIRYSALDYLLKPVKSSDIASAILRFKEKREQRQDIKNRVSNFISNFKTNNPDEFKLAVSTTEGTFFYPHRDIVRLEADSNYTKIYFSNRKPVLSSKTLKEFEDILAPDGFIRCHKSHLVNRVHITFLSAEHELTLSDKSTVDISRRKFSEIKEILK